MNFEKVKAAALELERQVSSAKASGYSNADCVLTPEVRHLLSLAKSGGITQPVQLQFTAGPARSFTETTLGECGALEEAWAKFRAAVESWESGSAYRAFKDSLGRP